MWIFGWLAAILPLAAIYFGLKALGQIDRLPEEYTGRRLAQTGIGLGAGLGILLSGCLIFGNSEVPHGYQPLNYADLEPNQNQAVSDAARKLSDNKTRVYIRGYMLPGKRQTGLKEFSICRTSDMCRFQTAITKASDLIRVNISNDLTMDYTTHQIGVGGIFRVDADAPGNTHYYIDADYLYR